MAQNDISLGVAKAPDKDAEIAELKKRLEAAEAKRLNDESSAFGRLAKEAELRKQRELELAEANKALAEMRAKNARSVLTPEQIEALGQTGAEGVERLVEAKLAPLANVPQPVAVDLAPIVGRLTAMEQELQRDRARKAYEASLVSWATQQGSPNLFARLSQGGDLSDKWAAFAQQNPGAVAAFESGDTGSTQAYVRLFMYENPGISQQAATPSASGGFAPTADSEAYGPAKWMADVRELDKQLETGQITKADHAKGFVAANAKLAAAAQNGR